MKWVVIFLSFINFGYMLFDGSRALITGSYITPSSGQHKGQLGPWTRIVSAVGLEPEGSAMKTIFVVWGLLGLVVTFCFFKDPAKYWSYMLTANVLSLWYAGMGTVSCGIQIILLILIKVL